MNKLGNLLQSTTSNEKFYLNFLELFYNFGEISIKKNLLKVFRLWLNNLSDVFSVSGFCIIEVEEKPMRNIQKNLYFFLNCFILILNESIWSRQKINESITRDKHANKCLDVCYRIS